MATAGKIIDMMERSSWVRKMFETGASLKSEFGAENVFDFSIGNPNVEPPKQFFDILSVTAEEHKAGQHGYMPNAGYPWVREKVADQIAIEQGVNPGASGVLMTCGAGGGLNVALKTIINPGDKVLVNTPYFVEYGFYVDNHGGVLESVPCGPDFDLDLAAIESRIDASTAAIIVNSPNNPSGKIYDDVTIKALGKMLYTKSREMGRTIYLISDEPYRNIVFDGAEVPSIFKHYRNSFVVTSYSKNLSLPGERIGWLAIHPEAEDHKNLVSGAVLCNRILGYVNAPAMMQRIVGMLQGQTVDMEIYRRKRDLLCEGLDKIGYKFLVPKGTFYLFPEAPGGDDLQAVALLQEEKVLTVPGRGFGQPGFFRISFCVDDATIINAMDGFSKAYSKLI